MGNTTTNVVQEYEEDDFINMEYIRGGVLTSIPNEVKPRPKIGRNPKAANKSNSKIKNESLRSALSVDLDNPEAERIRKEFEMFRLSKENELANFKRKEKKLETENRKLKTELQALQKTCKKLRDERDYALDAEQRALMRAAAIETDRDKVQRQFKIFRESKESELQNLLKVKRILESKIMKVDPSLLEVNFQKDDEPSDSWTAVDSIVGFYPPHSKDDDPPEGRSHGNRWLDDTTPHKMDRGDLLRNCSDIVTVCWMPCKGDIDLTERNLLQANLETCCKTGDHLLNFVRVPPPEGSVDQGEYIALASGVLTMATNSYFLGAIFSGFSAVDPQNVKMVEAVMSLKVPLHIFICSADHGDDNDDDDYDGGGDDDGENSSLLDALSSRNLNPSACVSFHRSFKDLCSHLEKAIKKKLHAKHREHELNCLNFMGWENIWRWQDWQDQLYHEHLARFHSPHYHLLHHHGDIHHHHHHDEGWQSHHHHQHQDHFLGNSSFEFSWLDKYLIKVTGHASSPGPVPPLLVEGVECSGKTTLLMRWIDQYRERSPPSLVLSYSVADQTSPSGDPSILLKCLMFQIMQCFSTPFALVLDLSQLVRDFPKWLEKVSTMFPGGVVLVLDSIERVKNFEVIFDWLMDPLPVDLRVIVSLRSDACPPSWRSWPLLSMDPMTEIEVREYVDLLANDSSKINKEAVLAHLLDNPSLCLPLPARLVAVISTLDSDIAEVLPACRTVRDIYRAILFATEEQLNGVLKESLRELLGLLCCSRQGLTLSELMEVTGRSEFNKSKVMVELVELMVERGLLRNLCSLIMVKNDEVRSAIGDWLSGDCKGDGHDDNPVSLAMNESLLKYHLSKLSHRQVTPRRVAELAWMSCRLQDWEKLRVIVSDLELCMTFLGRGLGSELVDYWRSLNYDLVTVSSKLDQKLQEYEQNLDNSKESQPLLSTSYELVGKFLTEQGLHEEALEILQRCDEFQGHDVLGPLKVGRVSNLLGHIHDKLGRRGVAETMYLTALSHFEGMMDMTGGQNDNGNIDNEEDDDGDDNDAVRKGSPINRYKVEKLQRSDPSDDDDDLCRADVDDDGDDKDDEGDEDDVAHEYCYHHLVAAQLDLLASFHLKQGRAEMSDNFLKRATNLRSKVNSKRANIRVGQVPSTESIRQRIEELNSSQRSGDLDDLSLAGVEHELGVLHALLGHYREAEAFLNGSLVKRESLLPSGHLSVVQSLNSLAALYGQSKQLSKVEELSEKLVQLVQKMAGHDPPLALGTMRNLVHISRHIGRMDKAEHYLEILLNLLKEDTSTPPYDFATALVNLAVVCSQQGKHSKAEPLYKIALNTFRSLLPPEHPRITETMKNLALSKYEQGDFEEAARLYLLTVTGNQIAPDDLKSSNSAHPPGSVQLGRLVR